MQLMGRWAHRLTTVKQLPKHKDFLAVDTETRNEDGKVEAGRHTLYFGVYTGRIDGKRIPTQRFESTAEWWDYVERYCKDALTVYAHNLNFDGAILRVADLLTRGWECTHYINDGNAPVIITFKRGRKRISLVDSRNYFRSTLESLGEGLGIPKLDMPADNEEWTEYANRDVEIVYQAIISLERFIKELDLEGLPFTIGGVAFAYWRNNLTVPVHIHSCLLYTSPSPRDS